LPVSDAHCAGIFIDGEAQFHAAGKHFFRKGVGQFNAPAATEMAGCAVAYVCPTLEEGSLVGIFKDNVESTFEANVELRRRIFSDKLLLESVCALASTLHQFFARCRSVVYATLNLVSKDFEAGSCIE
jgi:hypothetical protein